MVPWEPVTVYSSEGEGLEPVCGDHERVSEDEAMQGVAAAGGEDMEDEGVGAAGH